MQTFASPYLHTGVNALVKLLTREYVQFELFCCLFGWLVGTCYTVETI